MGPFVREVARTVVERPASLNAGESNVRNTFNEGRAKREIVFLLVRAATCNVVSRRLACRELRSDNERSFGRLRSNRAPSLR
jgi:hypothetical protein